jgi:ribosomal-protein-alanine N-acetyltransferase
MANYPGAQEVPMSPETQGYEIRPMQLGDLSDVLVNERRGYTHPWTEGIFRDCIVSGYECFLFIYLRRVIGHGILSVAAGESHILNVCIHPECQGLGFGKVLVEHLLSRAKDKNAERVFLEVRPSNLAAYKLYEKLGFNEIGVRPNYYPAHVGREDALVLGKEFPPD